MGRIDFAPLFGPFTLYFPLLCIIMVIMLTFDVIGRLGRVCGFEDFLFSAQDNSSTGEVDDGRLLIADGNCPRIDE
jgi:hypothetical protein